MAASWEILVGDCREVLRTLPERSVQCVVTSPPYFGLRDYGTGEWEGGDTECDHKGSPQQSSSSTLAGNGHGAGKPLSPTLQAQSQPFGDVCGKCGARRVDRQIGLEPTPDEFVEALVEVFREVRRVLRDDGCVFLNLGDSYVGGGGFSPDSPSNLAGSKQSNQHGAIKGAIRPSGDLKSKDLIGVPWMVAFALRADGWYLRSDIIWAKKSCMPESVTDRPTKSHEYVFLLSKRSNYFYDADAIREDPAPSSAARAGIPRRIAPKDSIQACGALDGQSQCPAGSIVGEYGGSRNKRSVWSVATQPFPGAHFAVFPTALVEPCVLAGSSPRACGVCGAPWRRVVERERWNLRDERRGMVAGNAQIGHHQPRVHNTNGQSSGVNTRTVGWESSCEHDDDSGSCTILDPFAGSGTVGVVAAWHHRSFIGVELNPEYAEMARARIRHEGELHKKPARAVDAGDGQESLFGGVE